MFGSELLTEAGVQALGWTLLHFVWQGFAVAAVLAVVRLFVKAARHRYAVSCAAMGAMVLMLGITLSKQEWETPMPVTVASETDGRAADAVSGNPSLMPFNDLSQQGPRTSQRVDRWTQLTSSLHRFTHEIVLFWFVGVLALSFRTLGGFWVCYRLKRIGTRALPDHLASRVERLILKLGIRQRGRVLASTKAAVPMVVGILRPVVLFPAASLLILSPDQLQAVLVHELAHVRRYDNLINLLQTVIETIFFYHPAVWWVSHTIRIEREHCCADVAAAASDRRSYAGALTALEELRSPQLAAAATDVSLLQRVRRLLVPEASHQIEQRMNSVLGYVVPVLLALVVATVTIHNIHAEEPNVAVDVSPALPHAHTTLASCVTPMMQLLHDSEWSMGNTASRSSAYCPMLSTTPSINSSTPSLYTSNL